MMQKPGCVAQGGVKGKIRSWVAWDDIGVMLYNIKDNRWCGNIGRAHKSNGIFIIADLQESTVDSVFGLAQVMSFTGHMLCCSCARSAFV